MHSKATYKRIACKVHTATDLKSKLKPWKDHFTVDIANNHLIIEQLKPEKEAGFNSEFISHISRLLRTYNLSAISKITLNFKENLENFILNSETLNIHKTIISLCLVFFPVFRHVKELSLYLPKYASQTYNILKKLGKSLNHTFKSLRKLSLKFLGKPYGGLQAITVKEVCQLLSQITIKLTAFSLRFPESAGEEFFQVSSSIVKQLASIHDLHLYFPRAHSEVSESLRRSVIYFGSRLLNLKKFSLNFTNSEVSCDLLEPLGFGNLMLSTNHLVMNFDGCSRIIENGELWLSYRLHEELHHVTQLSLSFKFCSTITDKGLDKIGFYITKYFQHLKLLSLDFEGWTEITDKGMKQFSKRFVMPLIALRHFSLNFSNCKRLTGKSLKYINVILSTDLKYLETLSLDLQGWQNVSSKWLVALGCDMERNLLKLRKFTLSFCHPDKKTGLLRSLLESDITDSALSQFSLHLGNVKCLRELTFCLLKYHKITDKGVKQFCSNMHRSINDLKTLTLDLTGCPKISRESENAITDSFKFKLKFVSKH